MPSAMTAQKLKVACGLAGLWHRNQHALARAVAVDQMGNGMQGSGLGRHPLLEWPGQRSTQHGAKLCCCCILWHRCAPCCAKLIASAADQIADGLLVHNQAPL